MATVLEELLIQIGVDVDEQSMKKLVTTSQAAVSVLNKVAIAGAAAAAAIVGYTSKMAGAADGNIKFARMTGISYEALLELQHATEINGGSAEELTGTLKGLTNAIGQLAIGRGPQEAIRRLGGLGLSMADIQSGAVTSVDLLQKIGDAIQGMAPARQAEFASQLGITDGVLKLLQQGRFSIESLRKEARELGFDSLASAKKAEILNDQITKMKRKLNNALLPLRLAVMEIATKVLPAFTEWVESNKMLLSQLPKLIGLFATLFVASKIIKWGTAIASVTKLVWGLVAAKTALAAVQGGGVIAGGARMAGSALLGGAGSVAGAAAVGTAALPVAGIVAGIALLAGATYGISRYLKSNAEYKTQVLAARPNQIGGSQDNRNTTFNIYDATDSRAVAREVSRELNIQGKQANSDFAVQIR